MGTLIIGIGGSGMKIGHHIKRLLKNYNPDLLTNNDFGFFFMESDKSETARVRNEIAHGDRSLVNEGDIFYFSAFNPNDYIRSAVRGNMAAAQITSWLDQEVKFPTTLNEDGLKQIRQLGRLAFYRERDAIKTRLKNVIDQMQLVNNNNATPLRIYVIASTCGGTGSSCYLDVVAAISDHLNVIGEANITAVLINSNYFVNVSDREDNKRNVQINAHAMLSECETFAKYYMEDKTALAKYSASPGDYSTKLEANLDREYTFPPFKNALIFDQNCSTGRKIPKHSFYSNISEILYNNFISDSTSAHIAYSEVNKVTKNYAGGNQVEYGTIGYRVIRFPKEEFQKYFELRYLNELFENVLLNPRPDEQVIIDEVKKFCEEAFTGDNNTYFREIDTEFDSLAGNEAAQEFYDMFKPNRYSEDQKNIREYDAIEAILRRDEETIDRFTSYLEDKGKNCIRAFRFDRPYAGSNNGADKLRLSFWKKCYSVIQQTGYYGILGTRDEKKYIKGFVAQVKDKLKVEYMSLTEDKVDLEKSNPTQALENARTKLLVECKPAGGWFSRSKKYEDINNAIGEYETCLNNVKENLIQQNIVKIKQDLLRQFAVGDELATLKNSYNEDTVEETVLAGYLKKITKAIGAGAEDKRNTLVGTYKYNEKNDNKAKDNNSLYEQFNTKLINEYIESSNEVFTAILPRPLDDYLTEDKQGWKRQGSPIDEKYSANITINQHEFANIFNYTDTTPDNLFIVSRVGDVASIEDTAKIEITANTLVQRATQYFRDTYFAADQPLGKFLNTNIMEAIDETIVANGEAYLTSSQNVIFPIHSVTVAPFGEKFINVPVGEQYEAYFREHFGIGKGNISQNPALGKNKVIFMSYGDGIQLLQISGNDLCKQAYNMRDMKTFRPHLFKKWNDYPDGFAGWQEKNNKMSINGKEYTRKELFLLCLSLDIAFKSCTGGASFLFITNPEKLKHENLVACVPISFDDSEYLCMYKKCVVAEEGGEIKFAVKIEKIEDKKQHRLNKENFEFTQTLNEIVYDDDFINVLDTFFTRVFEKKDEVKKVLDLKESKDAILNAAKLYKKKVELTNKPELEKRTKDVDFQKTLVSSINEVLQKAFEISLY